MDAEFTTPAYTVPDLHELLASIERNKKQVFCATDVYERIRDAVYNGGLGLWYRVVKCTWLEDGQVLLGPSEAEMMDVPFPMPDCGGHGRAPAGNAGA